MKVHFLPAILALAGCAAGSDWQPGQPAAPAGTTDINYCARRWPGPVNSKPYLACTAEVNHNEGIAAQAAASLKAPNREELIQQHTAEIMAKYPLVPRVEAESSATLIEQYEERRLNLAYAEHCVNLGTPDLTANCLKARQ